MLNIGLLAPGAGEYYIGEIASSAEDYYTGRGESAGRWVGSLAEEIGLHGEVDPDQFRAVLAGRGPDVVEYLPPERLVPGACSWTELREQHQTHLNDKPKNTIKDFKRYLELKRSASFDDDALRIACADLSTTPNEMLELLDRIDTASSGWRN